MTIAFDGSLRTGIGVVDGQHMNLIRFINELDESIAAGRDAEVVRKVVSDLVEYAAYHFADEERLMAKHAYPEFESHKNEHRAFKERIEEFQLDADLDMEDTSARLCEFLSQWLVEHIRDVDGPMGAFMTERGLQ